MFSLCIVFWFLIWINSCLNQLGFIYAHQWEECSALNPLYINLVSFVDTRALNPIYFNLVSFVDTRALNPIYFNLVSFVDTHALNPIYFNLVSFVDTHTLNPIYFNLVSFVDTHALNPISIGTLKVLEQKKKKKEMILSTQLPVSGKDVVHGEK